MFDPQPPATSRNVLMIVNEVLLRLNDNAAAAKLNPPELLRAIILGVAADSTHQSKSADYLVLQKVWSLVATIARLGCHG
jgi:hypothetical protein